MQQPIMEVEMGAIIEVEVPQDISQNIGVPAQPEHIVYKFPDRPIEYQNDDHAPGPISLRRVRTTMAEIIDICGRFVGTHDTGFVSKDQLLEYRVHDPETREPLVLPFNGSTNLRGWSRCQVQEFLSQIVSSRAAQAIAIRCLAEFELLMFKTKTRQLFEELNSLATHPNQKIQWRDYEKISREVGKVRRVQERPHQEESDKVAQDAQDLQNSRNEEADDGQGQDEAYLLEYDEANVALPDWEYLNAHLPQNVLNGVQEVPIALAPRMEVEVVQRQQMHIHQDISQNIGVPAQPEHIVYEFPDRPIEYQNDNHAPGPVPLRRVRTTIAEIIEICERGLVGTHETGYVSKDQLQAYRVHDPKTGEPLVLPFNGSTNMSNWSRCQVQEFLCQIVSPYLAHSIARRCLAEFELLRFEAKTVQFYEELNALATHPIQKVQWQEYEEISREVAKVRRVQLIPI